MDTKATKPSHAAMQRDTPFEFLACFVVTWIRMPRGSYSRSVRIGSIAIARRAGT